MGQPLTFNGVMWMDRNLGATSADMTTAEGWEGARGYVYQLGRSIPYYLPKTVEYTGSDGKKYLRQPGHEFHTYPCGPHCSSRLSEMMERSGRMKTVRL